MASQPGSSCRVSTLSMLSNHRLFISQETDAGPSCPGSVWQVRLPLTPCAEAFRLQHQHLKQFDVFMSVCDQLTRLMFSAS